MNFAWDWEEAWLGMLYVVVAAVVAFIFVAALADKKPTGYYLSPAGERTPGICVKQLVPWDGDPTVFCSDDINKVMTVLKQAQDAVK
jgi:hypothetical protein